MTDVRVPRGRIESLAGRLHRGWLDEVLAAATRSEAESVWLPVEAYARLVIGRRVPEAAGGPGTALKAILALFGISATLGCPCEQHARKMDAWGADECERRIDEIVGWLREQAATRGIPFSAVLAIRLVRLAIRRARKPRGSGQSR